MPVVYSSQDTQSIKADQHTIKESLLAMRLDPKSEQHALGKSPLQKLVAR